MRTTKHTESDIFNSDSGHVVLKSNTCLISGSATLNTQIRVYMTFMSKRRREVEDSSEGRGSVWDIVVTVVAQAF